MDIPLSSRGSALCEVVAGLVSQPQDRIKLVSGGRVLDMDLSLAEQGVRNSATVMVILIQDTGGGDLNDWNNILKCNLFSCCRGSEDRGRAEADAGPDPSRCREAFRERFPQR